MERSNAPWAARAGRTPWDLRLRLRLGFKRIVLPAVSTIEARAGGVGDAAMCSSLHGTPKVIRGAPLMKDCKFQKYRAAVWDRGCRGPPLPVSGGRKGAISAAQR